MKTLFCNRLSSSCDEWGSVAKGIRQLSVEGMDPDTGGCEWAARMIVENADTLDHLNLGSYVGIARDFAVRRAPRHDEMGTSLATAVKGALSESGQEPLIRLSLESLYLCGLDLGGLIRGEMALDIRFSNIFELRLESCPGLSQAFSLLMGQGGSSKLNLSALQDLFIRLEDPDPNFSASLESFLTHIRGLTHLQVLIDRALDLQDLKPILEVHGKTLRTLVWDERRRPRISLFWSQFGNLRVVSKNCPSLQVLAIPLDWETIGDSDLYHERV